MGRRNDHSRQQIQEMALEAAIELVADSGHAGMSARKVAAKIGYTVGTLYLVFQNLDDLIFQINLRTLKALRENILSAVNEPGDPVKRLKEIANTYVSFARDNQHLWRMIYEHPIPEKSSVMDEYLSVSRSLFTCIEEVLTEYDQNDPDSIPLQARALWGGVHGICVLSLVNKLDRKSVISINSLTDMLIERFVSGKKEAG